MIMAVIFSNTQWTFWDVMLLFLVWIPLVMLWFYSMIDIFRRPDLSGWARALWLLAIVFLPWIGTIGYLIFRPKGEVVAYPSSYGYAYGNPYGYQGQGGQPYDAPPPVVD